MYVPEVCGELRELLIREHHELPFQGHLDFRRTLERLRRHFWWPSMRAEVQVLLDGCRSCAVNKPTTQPARGVYSPHDVLLHRWEVVAMEFMSGLPTSQRGNDFLFLVVDRLTKRLVLIPTRKAVTGRAAARLFVERVFREHGLPRVIISDRNPRFTGAF